MRIVFALVFLIGIGIAGFAVYMAMQQMNSLQNQVAQLKIKAAQVQDLEVAIVATEEIRYGSALLREHAREVKFPKNAIPENAFRSLEELFGDANTPPRAVVRTMEADELILQSKVTKFGQDASVASRLNKGMRAFSLSVDVTKSISGFLNPGDRIDIYWTGRIRGQQTTKLILENIELIAVDQTTDQESNRSKVARTVTVEVSPQYVAVLTTAEASGRISLSLRGIESEDTIGALATTQAEVLGIVEEVEEVVEECFTQERRAGKLIQIPVPCSD